MVGFGGKGIIDMFVLSMSVFNKTLAAFKDIQLEIGNF